MNLYTRTRPRHPYVREDSNTVHVHPNPDAGPTMASTQSDPLTPSHVLAEPYLNARL